MAFIIPQLWDKRKVTLDNQAFTHNKKSTIEEKMLWDGVMEATCISCARILEKITLGLTGANIDDRDERVWNVFAKVLYRKVFTDREYIKKKLFDSIFEKEIQLVHVLKAYMKYKLMPL